MASYAKDDLISLADSADSTNGGLGLSPTSPTTFGSISNRMSTSTRRTAQRDSFSDLAVLMKAKKPYTPIPRPAPPAVPKVVLQSAINGTLPSSANGSTMPRPILRSATNGTLPPSTNGSAVQDEALVSMPPRGNPGLGARPLAMNPEWQARFNNILVNPGLSSAKATAIANRNISDGSIRSPLARAVEFSDNGPVADFLRQQEMVATTAHNPPIPAYRQQDLQRLESVTEWIKRYQIGEDESPNTPAPSSREVPLLPGFESPPRNGIVAPPTPPTSVRPPVPADDRASGPVVRLTKDVWDSMNNSLRSLAEEKRVLEDKLNIVEKQYQNSVNEDHDVGAQLGLLRYQNEVNRDQKSNMGRTLAQKEIEIKKQQLDIDELSNKIAGLEAELATYSRLKGEVDVLRSSLRDSEAAHSQEIDTQTTTIRDLEAENDRLKREHHHAGDHATRAQNLTETLTAREKMILDLRQKNMEEKMRVTDLEDKVEALEEKVRQEDIDTIKDKLREKSSACDRFRTQLKGMEQQLKLCHERLMIATNGGNNLRGAAHLVKPNVSSKLPKNVVSCSECYAKNVACDSSARCRNCTESNIDKCARWRCSMKHKLGDCTSVPCPLPHDSQGWLVLQTPRPEW